MGAGGEEEGRGFIRQGVQTDGDERENLRVGDFQWAQGRIKGGGWLVGWGSGWKPG